MVLVIEAHPVQYRAPLYATINSISPDLVHVLYWDTSMLEGYKDPEFGETVKWDLPLLNGYESHEINGKKLRLLKLTKIIFRTDPEILLLTGYHHYQQFAGLFALLVGKKLALRVETQDQAFPRSGLKASLRKFIYTILYGPISKAFAIGQLNREHYHNHGKLPPNIGKGPYVVNNPIASLSSKEKNELRAKIRRQLKVDDDTLIVGFSGKLIPKKNPAILVKAASIVTQKTGRKIHLLFIGTGELEEELKTQSRSMNIPSSFPGFVNQSEIHPYYLACDVLSLPSRQMGETWGLVVNEGLQAGCSILVSNYVGSAADFGSWERVRVFESDNLESCSDSLAQLALIDHDFDWCSKRMANEYSMRSCAEDMLKNLPPETKARPTVAI